MTTAAPKLPLGVHAGRTDLFEEFMRRPFGRHSPDLQSLLEYMRGAPIVGKHFLLMTRSNVEWMLARFTEGDPLGVERLPEIVFDNITEAERYVFRLRQPDTISSTHHAYSQPESTVPRSRWRSC